MELTELFPYLTWDCPLNDNNYASLIARIIISYIGKPQILIGAVAYINKAHHKSQLYHCLFELNSCAVSTNGSFYVIQDKIVQSQDRYDRKWSRWDNQYHPNNLTFIDTKTIDKYGSGDGSKLKSSININQCGKTMISMINWQQRMIEMSGQSVIDSNNKIKHLCVIDFARNEDRDNRDKDLDYSNFDTHKHKKKHENCNTTANININSGNANGITSVAEEKQSVRTETTLLTQEEIEEIMRRPRKKIKKKARPETINILSQKNKDAYKNQVYWQCAKEPLLGVAFIFGLENGRINVMFKNKYDKRAAISNGNVNVLQMSMNIDCYYKIIDIWHQGEKCAYFIAQTRSPYDVRFSLIRIDFNVPVDCNKNDDELKNVDDEKSVSLGGVNSNNTYLMDEKSNISGVNHVKKQQQKGKSKSKLVTPKTKSVSKNGDRKKNNLPEETRSRSKSKSRSNAKSKAKVTPKMQPQVAPKLKSVGKSRSSQRRPMVNLRKSTSQTIVTNSGYNLKNRKNKKYATVSKLSLLNFKNNVTVSTHQTKNVNINAHENKDNTECKYSMIDETSISNVTPNCNYYDSKSKTLVIIENVRKKVEISNMIIANKKKKNKGKLKRVNHKKNRNKYKNNNDNNNEKKFCTVHGRVAIKLVTKYKARSRSNTLGTNKTQTTLHNKQSKKSSKKRPTTAKTTSKTAKFLKSPRSPHVNSTCIHEIAISNIFLSLLFKETKCHFLFYHKHSETFILLLKIFTDVATDSNYNVNESSIHNIANDNSQTGKIRIEKSESDIEKEQHITAKDENYNDNNDININTNYNTLELKRNTSIDSDDDNYDRSDRKDNDSDSDGFNNVQFDFNSNSNDVMIEEKEIENIENIHSINTKEKFLEWKKNLIQFNNGRLLIQIGIDFKLYKISSLSVGNIIINETKCRIIGYDDTRSMVIYDTLPSWKQQEANRMFFHTFHLKPIRNEQGKKIEYPYLHTYKMSRLNDLVHRWIKVF